MLNEINKNLYRNMSTIFIFLCDFNGVLATRFLVYLVQSAWILRLVTNMCEKNLCTRKLKVLLLRCVGHKHCALSTH